MKLTSSKESKSNELTCPICEGIMKQYDFAYDTLKDVKINYKCDNCGHRSTKII